MSKMSSIQTSISGMIFRLLIPAGVFLVVVAILLEISGFVLANSQTQSISKVNLPSIHYTGVPVYHSTEPPNASARLQVFESQIDSNDSGIIVPGFQASLTSLPVLGNQKTLTLQQIADIIAYMININQAK